MLVVGSTKYEMALNKKWSWKSSKPHLQISQKEIVVPKPNNVFYQLFSGEIVQRD